MAQNQTSADSAVKPEEPEVNFLHVKEGKFSPLVGDYVTSAIIQYEDGIIYLNRNLEVGIVGDFEYPKDYPRIHNMVLALQAAPDEHLSKEQRTRVRTLCGNAIARVLDDKDPEAAIEILHQGWKYYSERSAEISRRWYLTTALVAYIPLLVLAIGGGAWSDRIDAFGRHALVIYFSVCLGGMGAFASTVLRLGRTCQDPSGGRLLHILEALARILVGCLSGFVIIVCLLSGVVFSFALADGDLTPYSASFYLALLLSLVSGLSEKMIPTLVERINLEAPSALPQEDKTLASNMPSRGKVVRQGQDVGTKKPVLDELDEGG